MQDIVPIEKKPLRDQIMTLVNKNEAISSDDGVRALKQCVSHIQNTIQVEQIIVQSGLSYDELITNDKLELYFNLVRLSDTKKVGYIAKGWDDPGFRIGDVINLEDQEESEQFKDCITEISRNCTSKGILMTVKEDGNGYIINLEGLIYTEGMNKDTFNKTLEALIECAELARALKCAMLGYPNELS